MNDTSIHLDGHSPQSLYINHAFWWAWAAVMWMGCEVAPKALSTRSVSTSYLHIYLSSWGVVTLTSPGHHLQVHSGHVVPVHPHHGLLLHSQPRCLPHSREPPQPHQVSTIYSYHLQYIYNIYTHDYYLLNISNSYLQHLQLRRRSSHSDPDKVRLSGRGLHLQLLQSKYFLWYKIF